MSINSSDTISTTLNALDARVAAVQAAITTPMVVTGNLAFSANAVAGTVVASITNVPVGSTPILTPNDGRLAIAGDAVNGWKIVVGNIPSMTGSIPVVVSINSTTPTITVNPVPVVIAFAGSSSPSRYLTETSTLTPDTRVTSSTDGVTFTTLTSGIFGMNAGKQIADATGNPVKWIAGGTEGSTLEGWEGPASADRAALVARINAATASGLAMTALVIQVGWNNLENAISLDSRLALLRSLISRVRTETNLPNLEIFMIGTQDKSGVDPILVSWQREAELTIANNDANVRWGAHVYDLPTSDGTHQTDPSYLVSSNRFAPNVIALVNNTAQKRSAYFSGVVRVSDTQADITLAYPAGSGTDFTPTTGNITGFLIAPTVATSGSSIAATGVRTSATTIRLTFASTTALTSVRYSPNDFANDIYGYTNDSLTLPLEITAAPLTLSSYVAPSVTYTATVKSAFVSFKGADTTNVAAGWNVHQFSASATPLALLTPTGTSTGWSEVATGTAGLGENNNGTPMTGNTSVLAPDAVLWSFWYAASGIIITQSLSGLDPAKFYDINFIADRAGAAGRITVFTINGVSQQVDVGDNTTRLITYSKVQPDSTGTIAFSWTALAGSTYSYLNALQVFEFTRN